MLCSPLHPHSGFFYTIDNSFGGSVYAVSNASHALAWAAARDWCTQDSATLAVVTSLPELQYLADTYALPYQR